MTTTNRMTSGAVGLALSALALATPVTPNELEIHGSNTIGARLAPMLVRGYLERRTGNRVITRKTGRENEQSLLTNDREHTVRVLVAAHGSSTGFKALAAGKADIWASSRPVKASEVAQFRNRADLTQLESEHVLAIDGLAILVHPANPVDQLSIETLAKIFSGQIDNWSQVGGQDRAIRLYARDDRSGTRDTFRSLVLGKRTALAPAARRYESNDRLSDDVSRDPAGIGFAGLASIRDSKVLATSEGDAPALKPNHLTVASEDYPLSRRLFLYTPGATGNTMASELIEFALAREGQDVVAKSGFISQNPIAVKPEFDDSVPASFRQLTRRYHRLTVNFRFAGGRTKPDNKALRDLRRLSRFLEEGNRTAEDLMLIGFADKQSNELRAQMISELRALSVRKALKKVGIVDVAYTGYGQYMPVGGGGNARNGRVEVWIRTR